MTCGKQTVDAKKRKTSLRKGRCPFIGSRNSVSYSQQNTTQTGISSRERAGTGRKGKERQNNKNQYAKKRSSLVSCHVYILPPSSLSSPRLLTSCTNEEGEISADPPPKTERGTEIMGRRQWAPAGPPFLLTSRSSNIRIPPAKRAPDWPHSLRPTSGGKKPQGSKEGEEKKTRHPVPHPISADPAACRRTSAPAASVLARRANQQPQGDRKGGWHGRPLVRERQQ